MCPLRLISKIFLFDEDELTPELRAQRTLNRARLPEIARYIVENPTDYVFSALTASVDGDMHFRATGDDPSRGRVGTLHIPMTARFVINDGQHRRAAIEMALSERPELGDESIAIVFFRDVALERSQQMFADLNRHAIRPSKSIGVLYDHRDETAQIVRRVVLLSPFFRDIVEMDRSTLALRSRKLLTLSAIYGATRVLLSGLDDPPDEKELVAARFWEAVADLFPEWKLVHDRKITSGEVRQDFIHTHGTVLHALGNVGSTLVQSGVSGDGFRKALAPLAELDWSRTNAALWEGRTLVGGRVSKAHQNVALTTNVLKSALGLDLTVEEQRLEDARGRGRRHAG